jgi:hypothetical protein
VEEGIQGDFDLEGVFSQYQIAYEAQAIEGTLEVYRCWLFGIGCDRDAKSACEPLQLFTRNPKADYLLGLCYRDGIGVNLGEGKCYLKGCDVQKQKNKKKESK